MYLLPPAGGSEVDITAWAVTAGSSAAKFVLTLPATVGTPPAAAAAPGVYQLRAGSGAPGTPGATRTGSIPVSIASYVDPTGGPVLAGPPPFTVHGAGFIPGATEVLVGLAALTETAGSPAPGEVRIDPSGTSFSFSPPAGPAGMLAAGPGPGARHRVGSRLVGDAVNPAPTVPQRTASAAATEAS